jgi:hypothetical protein
MFESFLQTDSVKRIYSEDSDTTLRAAGTTQQPLTTPTRGIRESRIDNLN